jgi:prevent-host-death family protein
MSKTVDIYEVKKHLSKVLKEIEEGKEIILIKSGKPIAKIVPLDFKSPRIPGIVKGKIGLEIIDPLPDDELETWKQ